jgi:hypothetical protein
MIYLQNNYLKQIIYIHVNNNISVFNIIIPRIFLIEMKKKKRIYIFIIF